MKFAVGYQLAEEEEKPFAEIVGRHREHIEEVYFPWLDMPSGRSSLTVQDGFVDWDGQRKLEEELKQMKGMDVKLDLLLNANCYGRDSLSQNFRNRVYSIVLYLMDAVGLDAVTTASLMIAKTVKEAFPTLDVRGSVNMRIGTVQAMEYIADVLDSFYIQREYNRDFARIVEMKEWADKHGKGLYMLANSGCLNFCSGQVFHDNLVAHEAEITAMQNVQDWNPNVCWNYYRKSENWIAFLRNSWIRPEDLHNYEPYFPMVKLATRMHPSPARVIGAYSRQRFEGNLMDLLEPAHVPLFAHHIIDNSRFPKDWHKKITTCDRKCHTCNYCSQVLNEVLVRIKEE